MIQLKHLTKVFASKKGTIKAIEDINLTVEDGDIFGIIGLSGAGKSTLVRCINLLEKPTSGRVIIDGVDLTSSTDKEIRYIRSNIGMIFQGFNLLEQRTVIDNICFPLELRRVPKEERYATALKLLETVGLEGREGAYPSELSGGQKQRVAIARALATNPKYLLCDEATSALDPNTTRAILALLQKINREMGVTIIIITHEMKVVESICNKVAVMDNAQIVESGKVSEVFFNPKSKTARELILPKGVKEIIQTDHAETKTVKLRLVFNGEHTSTPVISGLALEVQVPVNIIYANMREIEGRAYGYMMIEISDDPDTVKAVCDYMQKKNVVWAKEEY